MNARKIYDEPDVLGGVLENRLFLGILGGELLLQARRHGLAWDACASGRRLFQVLTPSPQQGVHRLDALFLGWSGLPLTCPPG